MEKNQQKEKSPFWNRNIIEKFIQLYKENVCLYDVSHENYNSKTVKTHALKNIAQNMKQYLPNLHLDDIQDKIDSIRNKFLEEISFIKASEASGEKYAPTLWCYEQLEFLRKHLTSSTTNNESKDDNFYSEETKNVHQHNTQSEDSDVSLYAEMLKSRSKQKKRKIMWDRDDIRTFLLYLKKYNILYDRKHKYYSNHEQRYVAYSKLLKEMKKINPLIELHDIRTKIHCLRCQYMKEVNYLKEAKRDNKKYTPKLWCFKMLANIYKDGSKIGSYFKISEDESDSNEETDNLVAQYNDSQSEDFDVSLYKELLNSHSKPTIKIAWRRNDIRIFISLFRKYNILYDRKHKNYRNHKERYVAYSKLLRKMKRINPLIDLNNIRNKIHTLRCQYIKEVRSLKNAQRENKTYIPKLWCFHLLANLYKEENKIKPLFNIRVAESDSNEETENLIAQYNDSHSEDFDVSLYKELLNSDSKPTIKIAWRRDDIKTFISLFKKYNILYDRKHENYWNHKERYVAYSKLVKKMKIINPLIDLNNIGNKIHTLRCQYIKEVRCLKKAKTENRTYIPKLWCFPLLANLYNDKSKIKSLFNINVAESSFDELPMSPLSEGTAYKNETLKNELLEFEEIQVVNENLIEYEEETENPVNIIKVQNNNLPNPIDYESINTSNNDSHFSSSSKNICDKENFDNYDEITEDTTKMDNHIRPIKYNKYAMNKCLGNLIASQMLEISQRYHTEFAWDVQCLLRKYILKSQSNQDEIQSSNSTKSATDDSTQEIVLKRSSKVSFNISFVS